jgi:cytochrome c-type biogenesis protein CcmH
MKKLSWITAFLIVLSTLAVATVSAQGSTPSDDQVNAIAKQLYCPVCENTPLDVCPTAACKEWREEIRGMLADGKSEAEIKQHFVDYYGARVLATPPPTGFNWLVYVVPPIAIVAGIFVLFRALRAWSRVSTSSPQGKTAAAIDQNDVSSASVDEYFARMEEVLKHRK